MYDLIFYYKKEDPTRMLKIREKFPTAKFIEDTGNTISLITTASKKTFTKMFWVIPINVEVDVSILEYKATEWDDSLIHAPVDLNHIYLVPKKCKVSESYFPIKHVDIKYFREIFDIIFISNGEENANENWQHLISRFPEAKRIDKVVGIFQAHYEASKISSTRMFYVVDADAIILPSFNFDKFVPKWDFDTVFIWRSQNSITGLEYGYGGVKLLPKFIFDLTKHNTYVDITTSLSSKISVESEVSNITNYATTGYSAWRAAFRECVKLASSVIINSDSETANRLEQWCTYNSVHPYSKFSIAGALAGKQYGQENAGNIPALTKINDYEWLKSKFKENSNLMPLEKFQK